MVDPVTIGAIASAAKPETLQAAGGLLESTGKGVGYIFHSVGTIGTEHHQISADANLKELEILSQMDADQLKVLAEYKKATRGNGGRSILRTLGYASPLTMPFSLMADLRDMANDRKGPVVTTLQPA